MATKKPYTVGYFSAYYRGAECLLDMWPQIYELCHKETGHYPSLSLYYGWQSWVSAEGEDSFYHRMTQKLKDVEKLGVTEHGRVSHEKLAEAMLETEVWAYPTEFKEIFAITAIKANAAGMKPVITDVAALKETGGPNATFIEADRIYTDDYSKQKFVKAVVDALKNPQDDEDSQNQRLWAEKYDWSQIAAQWAEVIK